MANWKKLPQCNPGYRYADQPPPGKVSDKGWCYRCSPGTYTGERNRDLQCKNCTVCSPELGQVEEQPCRPDADARCLCDEDAYALKNGRCRPNDKSTVTVATAKLGRNRNSETRHRSDQSESVTTENSLLQPYSTALQYAPTELGVQNLTADQAHHVIFFLGNTALTPPMLSVWSISFVCLVTLAAIAGIRLARWRRKAVGKKTVVEISQASDARVYEEPESLIASDASAPRIEVSVLSTASMKTRANLDYHSSPLSSKNLFMPLLCYNVSTSDKHQTYCDPDGSSAVARTYRDANGSSAFAREESFRSTAIHNARHGVCNVNGQVLQLVCDGALTNTERGHQESAYSLRNSFL